MPFTPNGKINRKALIIPAICNEEDFILPKTSTEKKLFNIVSELAQNTDFGINTDFFTIGLDSLNIIQISSKIIEEFNIEVAPSQLYKLLNIEIFAVFLDNNDSKKYSLLVLWQGRTTNKKVYCKP